MNSSTGPNERGAFGKCGFNDNICILRSIPHFSRMSLEALKVMAFLAKRVNYRGGEELFTQGDVGRFACHILEGRAELVRNGRVLDEFGPGVFVGGLHILSATTLLFSLRAANDLTALVFERELIKPRLDRDCESARIYMEGVVKAVVQWEERLLKKLQGRDIPPGMVGVSLA